MADLKFAVYAIDHASKTFGTVGKSMDKMGDKSSKMGDKFKKFGALAATGVAAAGVAVGAFAVVAVKSAIEDEASQSKLAQTLKKTQKARAKDVAGVEKWVDATSRASGVADDELRPALSNLLIAGQSTAQAQKSMALAMDVATAKGLPLAAVTKAMARAHNGNTGALSKLGIATKDASGKALSYKEIQKNLAKQMGGASAKAAETTQGKMKRLSVAFNEAKESIGAKLLPILLKMADWILGTGIPAIQKFGDWFQVHILPTLKEVGAFIIDKVIPAVVTMGREMAEKLSPKIDEIKKAFTDVKPQIDKFVNVLKIIGVFIVTKLLPIWMKFQGFIMGALLTAIKSGIKYFGWWVDAVEGIYTTVRDNVKKVKDKFTSVVEFVKDLPGKITRAASGMWDGIKTAFKSALNFIIDAWNRLEFKIPGIDKGPLHWDGFTLGVPDVPRMASGGIVNRPTLALIGESGPEAVIPLSRGRGMGGVTVIINGSVLSDEKKIADAVLRALKSQRSGGRALGLA